LTLVVVVDEKDVHEAEAAATTAASLHPCRLLIVIRRQVEAPVPRLDAEVLVGGRLGPGEAAVMRMYGRLSLHAESVVLPLLAPDAPVVTWWHGPPPDLIAHDPLGVFADRRVTDVSRAPDAVHAMRQRAADFAPGDTDLAWTRTTPWRAELASAFDTVRVPPRAATVTGRQDDPATLLLAGWLSVRFGVPVPVQQAAGRAPGVGGVGVSEVTVELEEGGRVRLVRQSTRSVLLQRAEQPDSEVTLPERGLGDLLAEELRRLDADQPYADALGRATGVSGLADRPDQRVLIWLDPMQQDGAKPVPAPTATSAETDTADSEHGEGEMPTAHAAAGSGPPGSGSAPAGSGTRSGPAEEERAPGGQP
ncbi:MAG TPA: glucose-6-phosphate dehydrogenase assembly protein OpcA, partial [Mycobacteriales bacterium]|nr:glucose-6-phosphate dehydrogenase assembly protein OpcA [Mycobacteriales bacterium]